MQTLADRLAALVSLPDLAARCHREREHLKAFVIL